MRTRTKSHRGRTDAAARRVQSPMLPPRPLPAPVLKVATAETPRGAEVAPTEGTPATGAGHARYLSDSQPDLLGPHRRPSDVSKSGASTPERRPSDAGSVRGAAAARSSSSASVKATASVKVPSTWTEAHPDIVGTLPKEEIYRQEVMYELLRTEEEYHAAMIAVKTVRRRAVLELRRDPGPKQGSADDDAGCRRRRFCPCPRPRLLVLAWPASQLFADPVANNPELIPDEAHRAEFIRMVFRSIDKIIEAHTAIADALRARAEEQPIVERVLDILAENVRAGRAAGRRRWGWRGAGPLMEPPSNTSLLPTR